MNKKFVNLVNGKDRQELIQMYVDLKKEYMNFRIASKSPTDEFKPSVIKNCRKNIARVKTKLRQMQQAKEGN